METENTIKGLGKNGITELTVQKSQPLMTLWGSKLSLTEFKILDIYLSRINSREPSKRIVSLKKSEIENVLGVKKINLSDLKENLRNLMSNVVEIVDEEDSEKGKLVSLFEEIVLTKDEDGTNRINLECSEKAMKYFFNVENLGYLRYKLRCITSITSRYSYIMFLFLEYNRFRKTFEVKLDVLKKILGCNKDDTYSEYKYFNKMILKMTHKELTEKTELRYKFEPIKDGKRVVAIRFTLLSIVDELLTETPVDNSLCATEELSWQDALVDENGNYEFTTEQMVEIGKLIENIKIHKLMNIPVTDRDRYIYARQKYLILSKKEGIKNKFSYFVQMLRADLDVTSERTNYDTNNEYRQNSYAGYAPFPERQYTEEEMKDLEKKLLRQTFEKVAIAHPTH